MDEKRIPTDEERNSYGSILHEVVTSTKALIQSEIELVKAEVKDTSRTLGRHVAQGAIFGALLALSALPFVAFLVIGLGRILDGNYWLSSLIVSVVFAAIGGTMTYRAYKKIKESNLALPRTRATLERSNNATFGKTEEVKEQISRQVAEIKETANRRAS